MERIAGESSKAYLIRIVSIKKQLRGKVALLDSDNQTIRPSKLIPSESVRIHPGGYQSLRQAEHHEEAATLAWFGGFWEEVAKHHGPPQIPGPAPPMDNDVDIFWDSESEESDSEDDDSEDSESEESDCELVRFGAKRS